jgi:hypothetical protein
MPSLKRKSTRPRSILYPLVVALACAGALALPAGTLAAPTATPELSFEPGSYDFGLQPIYQTAQATVQLKNDGAEEVWLESIGVTGSGSGNLWTDSSACWSSNPLAPGESCSLGVYFSPGEPTGYDAQLRVDGGGADFYADLSGEGASPYFAPDVNPVDFGVAKVGADGNTREIAIANEGNWPGGVFIAVISGGAVASYQILDENCTGRVLSPADACTVQVRFRPIVEGVKKATLSLFGESDGGTQISLTGTGAAPDLEPERPGVPSVPASTPGSAAAAVGVPAAGRQAKLRRAKARRARARRARVRARRQRLRRIQQRRAARLRHLRQRRAR